MRNTIEIRCICEENSNSLSCFWFAWFYAWHNVVIPEKIISIKIFHFKIRNDYYCNFICECFTWVQIDQSWVVYNIINSSFHFCGLLSSWCSAWFTIKYKGLTCGSKFNYDLVVASGWAQRRNLGILSLHENYGEGKAIYPRFSFSIACQLLHHGWIESGKAQWAGYLL